VAAKHKAFVQQTGLSLAIKAHLHQGENRAKLVGFKEQKKFFIFKTHANLAQCSPECK
jgi:hypothetical protein